MRRSGVVCYAGAEVLENAGCGGLNGVREDGKGQRRSTICIRLTFLVTSIFDLNPVMPAIQDFKIAIPESKLETLKAKLSLTEFPDELDGAGWSYGAPLSDIKRLHNHWLNSFDWRAQEQKLNDALPQYTTDVPVDRFGSITTHFIHQKSQNARAIPLLFCHGWPGSFIEVLKILPELVKGGKDFPAFHVVAPSLPNYGFSTGVTKVWRSLTFPRIHTS